jgi:hypothetical protein
LCNEAITFFPLSRVLCISQSRTRFLDRGAHASWRTKVRRRRLATPACVFSGNFEVDCRPHSSLSSLSLPLPLLNFQLRHIEFSWSPAYQERSSTPPPPSFASPFALVRPPAPTAFSSPRAFDISNGGAGRAFRHSVRVLEIGAAPVSVALSSRSARGGESGRSSFGEGLEGRRRNGLRTLGVVSGVLFKDIINPDTVVGLPPLNFL